jgi:tetratricopeptide (TPR) repeat protein/transcriptional regulator with XRE-family HTH domain
MFGEVVRTHRRRLGLSQEDLARRTGVGVRSIGKIETGRIAAPRPVTVRLLADAFGLSGRARERFCQAVATDPLLSGPTARPAQLPPDATGFVGRATALQQLNTLLAEHAPDSRGVLIAAIGGTVGVGKSTLACHWGHTLRDRFPDGQLYVNLRGFDASTTVLPAEQALRGFLEALEVGPERMPADLVGLAALYRTLLSGRRMLIMLDNARDAEQVRPLLPGAPGCLVVITSRDQLSSLVATDGAHPVALDLLSPQESRQLLVRRLGRERIAAEPEAVQDIITYAARLPLALTIVAARAAAHPHFPLHTFAAQLHDSRDRLDALAVGEDPATDVRAVISWSYRTLGAQPARLFRLLGVHPGPDLSAPAAAALAGIELRPARRLLAELAGMHLIVEHVPGRYAFHDLLRAYALEQARLSEPEADRAAALRRALDHYLHTGYTAALRLNPARDAIELIPSSPGVRAEELLDHEQAMAWFRAEHTVLMAAIDAAERAGLDTRTWQLAWTLVHFLDRTGHWHDWAVSQQSALAAARRAGDPGAEAGAHRFLAMAYLYLGRSDEACRHLEQALELDERTGNRLGLAFTRIHLGLAWVRQGDHPRALRHSQRSLALFEALDHRVGQALALNGIGWLQAQLGDHAQALQSCSRALTLAQEIGGADEQAAVWDSLGTIHARLGHHYDAVDCYRRARSLRSALGDRYGEAGTLTRLGQAQHALGDHTGARTAWREALAVLDALNHPDAEQVRERLRD